MKRKPLNERSATAVDRAIAKNILSARQRKNVTQMKLAEAVGVTFQQVQKYESATNRISASRLFEVAKALGEPVQRFFEGAQ